jgi:cytochrome c-type biogenesis protein CcmH/NrfF
MRLTKLSAFVLFLLLPAGLSGQIPEGMEDTAFRPHAEAERAISQIYSPFCPGFMLEVCPVAESVALRDSIQYLAYQGWSSAELVDWVIGNYGEHYRAVPPTFGWGLWAWLLPPMALIFGAIVVTVALRKFRPSELAASRLSLGEVPEREVSGEEEERLRHAIREIELSEDPSF